MARSAAKPSTAGTVASGARIKPGERSTAKREALECRAVPRPLTCRAAAPGPMPVARSAARPSMPARWRAGAKIKPGEALHREALDAGDVPCPSTCHAAGQDRCRWGDRPRWRAAPGSSPASPARRSTVKRLMPCHAAAPGVHDAQLVRLGAQAERHCWRRLVPRMPVATAAMAPALVIVAHRTAATRPSATLGPSRQRFNRRTRGSPLVENIPAAVIRWLSL